MKAEIISVGTELLLGHTINTDAAFIARELAKHGVELQHVQVVGDNPERLENALREALDRSDMVITSGGLGPTSDDLTKEVVSRMTSLKLEVNEECLTDLKEYFGDRPIGENQYKQCLIPQGAHIFKNPHGTAPGCAVKTGNNKYICLLPGPPRELVPMVENELARFLKTLSSRVIKSVDLRTFGIGEGLAAEKLGSLVNSVNPSVATYAAEGEMFVKVTASAKDQVEADTLISPVLECIRDRIGNFIYGTDVKGLEDVVVDLLRKQKLRVATAESCTGGLLAKRITDVPGASEIFHLGVITYANDAKEKILHVTNTTLKKFGAVSPQTAIEMAEGIKSVANADFGIGITGIAGPDGGSVEKPVGLVYIAVAGKETFLKKMEPHGRYLGRDWVRNRAASTALDMLRRILSSLPVE